MIRSAHIETAKKLIASYEGVQPFHLFLKTYFAANKKHGSKDRKQIASLCYYWFRWGKAGSSLSDDERWGHIIKYAEEGQVIFSVDEIFPEAELLGNEIDAELWAASHLAQPKVFLRVRPNKLSIILTKLQYASVAFELLNDTCIAVEASTPIDQVLEINHEVVVQDYSSQQVLSALINQSPELIGKAMCWDACAASGGKSILAHDLLQPKSLYASDVRPQMMTQLRKRLQMANVKFEDLFTADLSIQGNIPFNLPMMDVVITDVPCSGSGTWRRTPEGLYNFQPEQLNKFVPLQRAIVEQTIAKLKNDGWLVYITCSVFKDENEAQISFFENELGLECMHMQYFAGYKHKADTLFAALLRKKSN